MKPIPSFSPDHKSTQQPPPGEAAPEPTRDPCDEPASNERVTEARSKLLEIPLIPQERPNWCWAACSEMIVTYLRQPDVGLWDVQQCDLATDEVHKEREAGEKRIVCCDPDLTENEKAKCNTTGFLMLREFRKGLRSTMMSGLRDVIARRGVTVKEEEEPWKDPTCLFNWQVIRSLRRCENDVVEAVVRSEDYALGWTALTRLIDAKCPVALDWRLSEGSNHLMIAAGYVVTPPHARWVVINDPRPQHSGDIFLVTYEYYVSGPYRHRRDHWVLHPDLDEEQKKALGSRKLSPGEDLVRRARPEPDYETAESAALAGLEAVRAIAEHPDGLAPATGMGNAGLRALAVGLVGMMLNEALNEEDKKLVQEEFRQDHPTDVLAPVPGDELELDRDNPIDVYQIWAHLSSEGRPASESLDSKHLLTNIEGDDQLEDLFRAKVAAGEAGGAPDEDPDERIYLVSRKTQKLMPFFSAITVRRTNRTWKPIMLGRMALMTSITVGRFLESLRRRLEKPDPFSAKRAVTVLAELGVLPPVWRLLAKLAKTKPVHKRFAAREEGEEAKEGDRKLLAEIKALDALLAKTPDTPDLDALRDLGRRVDVLYGVSPKAAAVPDLPRMAFLLEAKEFGQTFIVYDDSNVTPVYNQDFYPPEERVGGGSLRQVLEGLRRVARAKEERWPELKKRRD